MWRGARRARHDGRRRLGLVKKCPNKAAQTANETMFDERS